MVLPSGGVHLPHVGNDAPRQAGLPDLLGVGVQHVGNLHVRTARGLQLPQQTLRDGLQRRPFSLVCGGGNAIGEVSGKDVKKMTLKSGQGG